MSARHAEQWAPIAGWEGLYEVSSHGRVRSLLRVVPRSGTAGPMTIQPKVLAPILKNGHHYAVQLRDTSRGRSRQRYIHQLVAEAFLPNPSDLPIVRHLDDEPENNYVENLAWGTYSDNAWDKVRNGNHHNARKTHCPSGHPYSGDNLMVGRRGNGSAFRMCRACGRARHQMKGLAA